MRGQPLLSYTKLRRNSPINSQKHSFSLKAKGLQPTASLLLPEVKKDGTQPFCYLVDHRQVHTCSRASLRAQTWSGELLERAMSVAVSNMHTRANPTKVRIFNCIRSPHTRTVPSSTKIQSIQGPSSSHIYYLFVQGRAWCMLDESKIILHMWFTLLKKQSPPPPYDPLESPSTSPYN